MKKVIIYGSGILMLAIVWISMGLDNSSDTIKIGVISPFTGDAAAYGEVVKNAAGLVIDDINQKGGIDGKKVEAIYEDTKCNGKDALTAVTKLIDLDKVNFIVGGMCSSEVLGALPKTERHKVIFLGLGSSPEITGKGKYFFRTWPSDAMSSKEIANLIQSKYKTAAIITEKTDYTVAVEQSLKDNLTSKEVKLVASEFTANQTKDYRGNLLKIKELNPEVIFANTQTGQSAALIEKQARDLGITSRFVVYFFTGDEFVKSGPAVNGTIILDNPTLDETREVSKKYVEKYKQQFGKLSYPFVGAQVYDQISLLKQAVESVGLNSDKLKTYFSNVEYEGIIGNYSFDTNGDVIGVGFSFKEVVDNVLTELK